MLTAETAKQVYEGDGQSRVFPIPFTFFQNAAGAFDKRNQVRVIVILQDGMQAELEEDLDYQISAQEDSNNRFSGAAELFTAPQLGQRVIILRDVPLTQETDLREGQAIDREVLENSLDKLTMGLQQLAEKLGRAVVAPEGMDSKVTAETLIKELNRMCVNIQELEQQAGAAAARSVEEITARFNTLTQNTEQFMATVRTELQTASAAQERFMVKISDQMDDYGRAQEEFIQNAVTLLTEASDKFDKFITDARATLDMIVKRGRGWTELDFLEVDVPTTAAETENN